MSPRLRLFLFLIFGSLFFVMLLLGYHALPGFGRYPGPYGDLLNRYAVGERHLTNVVTSINFDYRGLDTMGEEYILFVALAGLSLLLRGMRGETEDAPREAAPGRKIRKTSDVVRWLGLGLTGATNLVGLYIVLHAQLTPGGGFQGGAILGTAALLAYLATGYRAFKRFSPEFLLEFAEAGGAGAYVMIGVVTLLLGGAFLENDFPLGKTGSIASAGTIAAINFFVGVEVSAGFVLMFSEFLKETRLSKKRSKPAEEPDSSRQPAPADPGTEGA